MHSHCLTASGLVLAGLLGAATGRADPVPIAIAGFTYVDTSGEVQDQTKVHAERLQTFMQGLRGDLQQSGQYTVLTVGCQDAACSGQATSAPELMDAARRAHARLLLFGGIHKQSTLIEWAKADVVDLDGGKVIYDRLLTFRGDSDQAWQQAEAFLARDLAAQHIVP